MLQLRAVVVQLLLVTVNFDSNTMGSISDVDGPMAIEAARLGSLVSARLAQLQARRNGTVKNEDPKLYLLK